MHKPIHQELKIFGIDSCILINIIIFIGLFICYKNREAKML
jgi:hypothetical protein